MQATNGLDTSKPLDATVVDLFDDWAARAPDRVAAEWQGERLTYDELRNASLHISQALLSAGVRPRDKAPLLTQMSLEMLPAVIGILRVGACYMPLDVVAWSLARIRNVLSELSSTVAVVTSPCPGLALPVITVNFQKIWLHLPLLDDRALRLQLDVVRSGFRADDLAWIVFTSGTTGKPKGVMVYHRAIYAVSVVTNEDLETAAAGRGSRCLLAYSIAFDGCAGIVWLALAKGCTLVMASPSNFPEVSATCDLLSLTPSMLATMNPCGLYEGVRYIYLGGEAPVMEVVRQWIRPNRKVINTYGPSETTVTISFGELKPNEEPPFGELIPDVKVVLVDEDLQECDHGEVMIAGPGLAAGYLNNPELTAKKIIQWKGERFYRTGDLARRTEEGQLVWAGRADSLVKNRGFLINLETEVEPALLSFTLVRFAVAFIWRGRLVGCVQPANISIENLRQFMKERFDPFVVPDIIFAVDSFPLRANGKTDRDALKAQLEETAAPDQDYFNQGHPASAYEALLGGNSLTAIKLANFLKKHGHPISVAQILKLDTIGLLEEGLNRLSSSTGLENNKHGVGPSSEKVPVTDVQKLFLTRSLESTRYCALIGITKYVGDPSTTPIASELYDAFVKVFSAHDIFQTRFDLDDFTLSDLGRLNLDWHEVSVNEEDFESACAAVEEKAWLDLEEVTRSDNEVPYCHVTCVSVPGRKALAFVSRTHHVLVDMFSSAILSKDMERALAGEEISQGPSFKAFAKFMQKYKLDNLERAIHTFDKMVEPLPVASVVQLPSPRTPPRKQAFDLVRFNSPTGISKSALDTSARHHGITTSTMAYAAWALFLADITGWNRVGFSISLSGRTVPWPWAQSVVGPLLSRVPFSNAVPTHARVHEWLAEVHKTNLDVLEFDGLVHSFPDSLMFDPRTNKTFVLCFLDVPQTSPNWSYTDKQRHNYLMDWSIFQDGTDVTTVFQVQSSQVDLHWAEKVSVIPSQMLSTLLNSTEETLVGDLLRGQSASI
ncbi:hypothetical protein DL762_005440 [Monosporascus cannonballus]|uniref:Carrier domain-containing protein n=1 Tax=Monosporascus cannonballus TaxID=155416 RepID=A0ABY0H4U8_9PEZI|nr:hypothetical protein DL762_005440 [Monosporascus cannonballus]